MTDFSRREFLRQSAGWTGLSVLGSLSGFETAHGAEWTVFPVAGIATVYHRDSHADVILGKILEGYNQQGGPGPALKLVSLYVDQFPKSDLIRDLAKKYKVPIFKTIEEAVTVGGNGIPVAGVLSIALKVVSGLSTRATVVVAAVLFIICAAGPILGAVVRRLL